MELNTWPYGLYFHLCRLVGVDLVALDSWIGLVCLRFGGETAITGGPSAQPGYLLWPEQEKIKGNVEL